MDLEERVLGCIFGGAIGDAFGYPIEFDSLDDIRRRFGPDGKREVDAELTVSDDTQMTLFTIEGLISAHRDDPEPEPEMVAEHVFEAYLRWAHTQGVLVDTDSTWGLCTKPVLRAQRAPGGTCLSALASGIPGSTRDPINESKGCGGIMRVAPIGLLAANASEWVFEAACEAAALTHGHPTGWLSAGAFAHLLHSIVNGASLEDAVAAARSQVARKADAEETLAAIDAAHDATSISDLGEGWVAEEALAMAVFGARHGSTFVDALALAANHDGDSDSTASLTGQLWGALHGLGAVEAWVDRLDAVEETDRMATRMADLASG